MWCRACATDRHLARIRGALETKVGGAKVMLTSRMRKHLKGAGIRADARAFIRSKGADAEFQPVPITDESMDKLAKAMGCPVESMTFDPYPV